MCPGRHRRGQRLRGGIAALVGASLVLLGCVREPGPEEIALQYGRALYASDLVEAYRFISVEDRRVKDESGFRRERGEASGFALEVGRQLASFIEATPVEKTVKGERATVRLKLRLPNANAPEIVGLVGEWDERRLNALPPAERTRMLGRLEELRGAGRLPMIEGEETFELVREGSGWRVSLNFASGVRVRFQARAPESLALRLTVSPEEARVVPGDRVRVTVRATNLSGKAARARVGHRVEPRTQADSLALLQCPLFVPLTLPAGESQEFISEFLVLKGVPQEAKEFRVTYEFGSVEQGR